MSLARDAIKDLVLGSARVTGAMHIARRRHRRCLRILAYHGVEQAPDASLNFDGFHIEPARFRDHLEELGRSCKVLPLADAVARLAGGEPLPDHAAAITFDDGYLNNVETAAPILREFGMPATFFVTTGFMDGTHRPWWFDLRRLVDRTTVPTLSGPDGAQLPLRTPVERRRAMTALERVLKSMTSAARDEQMAAIARACELELEPAGFPLMSPADVRKLADMGFDIGPHTVSHLSMGAETGETLAAEIRESTRRVISVTGQRPRCYSYPYGRAEHISTAATRALQEEGYTGAVTTMQGMNAPGADAMRLRRLNVTGGHGPAEFEALVTGFTISMKGRDSGE